MRHSSRVAWDLDTIQSISLCWGNEETGLEIPSLSRTVESVIFAPPQDISIHLFSGFSTVSLTSHIFHDIPLEFDLISLMTQWIWRHLKFLHHAQNQYYLKLSLKKGHYCITLFCDNIRITTNTNSKKCSTAVQGEALFLFCEKNNLIQHNENRLIETVKTLFPSWSLWKQSLICTYSFYRQCANWLRDNTCVIYF